MVDSSSLSPENVIATVLSGVALAVIAVRKYLSEKRAPTAQSGDRLIPGLSIADMQPLRDLVEEQARTSAALERLADAAESVLRIWEEQAREEEIESEVERRLAIRRREEGGGRHYNPDERRKHPR